MLLIRTPVSALHLHQGGQGTTAKGRGRGYAQVPGRLGAAEATGRVAQHVSGAVLSTFILLVSVGTTSVSASVEGK